MLGFFISKSSLWFLSLLSSLGEDDTCPEENEDLALKEASLENKGRTSNPSESATFCQISLCYLCVRICLRLIKVEGYIWYRNSWICQAYGADAWQCRDDTCPEENEDLALKEASLENKGRTSNPSESATFCQWKAIFGIGIVGYVKLTAPTLGNAAVMAA
ncbi:hypothetical protein F2Q68_00000702 [Brassica cretica]|uniref:Uncharacterized protein n=1 Tax=Brassica cretica TaxID=69181 RepID=A0A8S9JDF2_BRACR|nr:hypothetical protein F2Q68_00000702 [Brassica cretica]